jgi:hypothetical protein
MVHDERNLDKKLSESRFWKIFIRGFPKKVLTLDVEQFTFLEVVVCSGSERVFENTNRVICDKCTVCRFLANFLFHTWARRALNSTEEADSAGIRLP